MPAPLFTSKDIAEGARLFSGDWRFLAAAASSAALPAPRGVEVAFAGRSNVGKSSLVNALTGRHGLARVSHTPGRTRELNFFSAGHEWRLVDMPGYGYAVAAKTKIAAWSALIGAYLRGRANLARVYVLIDARHGLKAADGVVFDILDEAAVSYQIVLTKADKVTQEELAASIEATAAELARRTAAHPEILVTSAHARSGIAELRAAIARLVMQHRPRGRK